MNLGKDLIGNPIITVSKGKDIGRLKDLYLTADCQSVAALYLGSEGLFSRQSHLIHGNDVVVIGPDATLVKHDQVIRDVGDVAEAETWLRRDELQGRPIDTPGGTKVGRVGDVIIDDNGTVIGFALSHVYVTGPIADNRAVALHTVQDIGTEDGVMTIDLKQAEAQKLVLE